VVTHPIWVREFPGSIPGYGKGFLWIFVFLLFVRNTLFVIIICNFVCNVNLFNKLYILQSL